MRYKQLIEYIPRLMLLLGGGTQFTFSETESERHLALMFDFYGQERRLVLFRKHIVKYVCGLAYIIPVKQKLITCTRLEEFIALMHEYETEVETRELSYQMYRDELTPKNLLEFFYAGNIFNTFSV